MPRRKPDSSSRTPALVAIGLGFIALAGFVMAFALGIRGPANAIEPLWLAANLAYPVLYVFAAARSARALRRSETDRALSWSVAPVPYAVALAAVLIHGA